MGKAGRGVHTRPSFPLLSEKEAALFPEHLVLRKQLHCSLTMQAASFMSHFVDTYTSHAKSKTSSIVEPAWGENVRRGGGWLPTAAELEPLSICGNQEKHSHHPTPQTT